MLLVHGSHPEKLCLSEQESQSLNAHIPSQGLWEHGQEFSCIFWLGPGVPLPNLLPRPPLLLLPLCTGPAASPWDHETLPSAGFMTASWSRVAMLPAIPVKQTPENYPLGPGLLRKFLERKVRQNPGPGFPRSKTHYPSTLVSTNSWNPKATWKILDKNGEGNRHRYTHFNSAETLIFPRKRLDLPTWDVNGNHTLVAFSTAEILILSHPWPLSID